MMGYGVSLGLAVVGLAMFFRNSDPSFDRSLFWRPRSGKQHKRDCWKDEHMWKKIVLNKEEERWLMVKRQHPIYLPFDEVTPWICEHLVEKYEDKSVERPEWMNAATSSNFIKRIAVLYRYHGKDENEVDEASEAVRSERFGP
ncbi:hypothetical protein TrLO_g12809 [Triparma laevis f. longispina]|uniref:Uncharacterized protein n=1 Tax=Triparma laevis f. longispina TaxID=1714387 RepID=A0A9W7DTD2_9STRA|nr:hypothetical protein TrLO_g12809 [Triparma laevis f. longispina]